MLFNKIAKRRVLKKLYARLKKQNNRTNGKGVK